MPTIHMSPPGGSSAQSSAQEQVQHGSNTAQNAAQSRGGKKGQKRTDGSGRQSAATCPMCDRDFTSENPLKKFKGTPLPRCRGYGACDICRGAFTKYCKGGKMTDPAWQAKYGTHEWDKIRDRYIEYRNGEDSSNLGHTTITSSKQHDRSTQRVDGNFWPEDELNKQNMPVRPDPRIEGQSAPYWETDPKDGKAVYGVLRECRLDGPPYTLPPCVFQVMSKNLTSATQSKLEDDSSDRLYEEQGYRFSP